MIIIAKRSHQLGNRLILFANWIAFCEENQIKLVNLAFDPYEKYFESTSTDLLCRYPVSKATFKNNKAKRYLYLLISRLAMLVSLLGLSFPCKTLDAKEYKNAFFLDKLEQINAVKSAPLIFARGYFFRDPTNVTKHAGAIRVYFRPARPYRDNVSRLITKLRAEGNMLIGVHIRQGDYKKFMDGKYFYESVTYVSLMRQVEKLFKDKKVCFLVCSNVEQDEAVLSGLNFVFGTNQMIEDMYSLAACDYIMGAPSSFSRWASFYGEVPLYAIDNPAIPITLDKFQTVDKLGG
ncbi:MAG: alpha-1,2-fucosyltransferase [Cyanobacteria bacterium P01_F01_bin.150]